MGNARELKRVKRNESRSKRKSMMSKVFIRVKWSNSQWNFILERATNPVVRKFVTPKILLLSNKLQLGLSRCHLPQKGLLFGEFSGWVELNIPVLLTYLHISSAILSASRLGEISVAKRTREKHVNARWERGREKMMGAYKREVGEMVFQTQTGLPSILYLLTIRCYMNLSYIFFPMKISFSKLTSFQLERWPMFFLLLPTVLILIVPSLFLKAM